MFNNDHAATSWLRKSIAHLIATATHKFSDPPALDKRSASLSCVPFDQVDTKHNERQIGPELSRVMEIRYVIPGNTIVAVQVHTSRQAQAVEAFALESSFRILPADESRGRNVVHYCTARTHPGGEVIWG